MTTIDPNFTEWEAEIDQDASADYDEHSRLLDALDRLPYLKDAHADRAQIFTAATAWCGNADAWTLAAPIVLCMRNGTVPLSLNDLVIMVCRPSAPHNPPTRLEITWALEEAGN